MLKLQKHYRVMSVDDTHGVVRYKMTLFDIIGIDSDGKTVLLGQALLDSKDTEAYEWVFEQLKQLLPGLTPIAIMSDGDPAIAAAVKLVFPETQHLLCIWHLESELRGGTTLSTFN